MSGRFGPFGDGGHVIASLPVTVCCAPEGFHNASISEEVYMFLGLANDGTLEGLRPRRQVRHGEA